MSQPTGAAPNLRMIEQQKSMISIKWDDIEFPLNGGSSDIDYKVMWNQGSEINVWAILSSSTASQKQYIDSTKNFVNGKTYQFKVIAFNEFGDGPESAIIDITPGLPPSGLAAPSSEYNIDTN